MKRKWVLVVIVAIVDHHHQVVRDELARERVEATQERIAAARRGPGR